jgi:hypothetical protein
MKITKPGNLILLILLITSKAFGAIGCIDYSYHHKHVSEEYFQNLDQSIFDIDMLLYDPDEHKVDYKAYHYVNCTCECRFDQDVIIENRGHCSKCGHFGDVGRTSAQNSQKADEFEKSNFAVLGEIVNQKLRVR